MDSTSLTDWLSRFMRTRHLFLAGQLRFISRARRRRREYGPLCTPGALVRRGLPARLEKQGIRVTQVRLGPRALRARLEILVLLENKDLQAKLALAEKRARVALLALQVSRDLQEPMEQRDRLERLALQAQKEKLDLLALLEA